MKTADLSKVRIGIDGYISDATEKENYQQEDNRLKSAIIQLSKESEKNQAFLTIANRARMDIAWMSKDEDNMSQMCAENLTNMSSQYPSHRLYDIMEGGMVMAPELNLRVSKNIFKALRPRERDQRRNKNRSPKIPHFVPVCIDGQLMAALVNAPTVLVGESE